MEAKVYSIIYRIRRTKGAPEIRTKDRTVFLPVGTQDTDLSRPVLRLIFQFGFTGQYVMGK